MESKSKYFLEKNFFIYFLGKIGSSVFNFASITLFIKYFGINNFGKFSLLYTTFLMSLSGVTGWINQGILRFYSVEEDKALFMREVKVLTLKSVVVGSIFLIVSFAYVHVSIFTITLALPAFLFACLYTVLVVELQANFKSQSVILSDIVRLFIYLAVPLILYFTFPNILPEIAFFIGVLLSNLGALLMINNWKMPAIIPQKNIPQKWSKKIWKYGSPLSIWLFLSPSLNTSDKYVIQHYSGSVALGQYAAIYDVIFRLFSQLTGPFYNILHPLLINAYNAGLTSDFRKIMLRSGFYLTLMFTGLFIVVYFLKSFIIYNYLGFKSDVAILIDKTIFPLLISSYIWQVAVLFQKVLEIMEQTKTMALYMLISVVLGLLSSIYFVPQVGFIAAAYSMLFSSIVYLLLVTATIIVNYKSKKTVELF